MHPGELVRLGDQDGVAFAAAIWFILCFQVIVDAGSVNKGHTVDALARCAD